MLPVLIIFVAFFPATESLCHGSRTSYRTEFIGPLVRDNQVLLGHVFANFSVQNFTQCSGLCKDDCRCRSFNLPMSGQGQCALNDADNSTALLRPLHGSRYHHLETKEFFQGDGTCWQPYSNGCCSSNPCENNAMCSEVGDDGKPGFRCACTVQGYFGQRCERRIRSCFDYMWNNKDSVSGYYYIWNDDNTKVRVYCQMVPEKLEAWTVVMSYDQSENDNFKDKPLFLDHAMNEDDASSGSYRLSLAKMNGILEGMKQEGRELEWKATCGFSFADGTSTSNDVVRSRFTTLDIMKITTNADRPLVGYYPFSMETKVEDKSGYKNHGSLSNIGYVKGPLGDVNKAIEIPTSMITLNDNSGKLDTRFDLTMMVQALPYDSRNAPLVMWGNSTLRGVNLWQYGGDVFFESKDRTGNSNYQSRTNGLGINIWNYIAITYDYKNRLQSIYINGTLMTQNSVSQKELATNLPLTVGRQHQQTSAVYYGRLACLKIYNGVFTKEEIKQQQQDWKCPENPEPLCERVDYISIRGNVCYGCTVWATQSSTQAFTINAHLGDKDSGCNFKSGSTVENEKLFGVYDAKDGASHACAATSSSSTQYWFGGRL